MHSLSKPSGEQEMGELFIPSRAYSTTGILNPFSTECTIHRACITCHQEDIYQDRGELRGTKVTIQTYHDRIGGQGNHPLVRHVHSKKVSGLRRRARRVDLSPKRSYAHIVQCMHGVGLILLCTYPISERCLLGHVY